MAVRNVGGGGQPPQNPELRARNAAGKQAKESPLAKYQRPHRVHTGAERRVAHARKRAAELDDEAIRHVSSEGDQGEKLRDVDDKKNKNKLKGINFDERRKKKGRRRDPDQDQENEEAEESAKQLGLTEGTSKYFEDLPEDRMGDLSLVDPNEIKRLLGPPVRFAQHAMLLAENQRKEGMPREEALDYMAKLYLGLEDRAYANKALKQFGAATGIIDLYPLEVMKQLLLNAPGFLQKVSVGHFFVEVPQEGLHGKTGEPIVLTYDSTLRVRGFALKGGEKPGYVFEPVDPPGTYHLTFSHAGNFIVMISALTKKGELMIEEFVVEIEQGDEVEESETERRARGGFEEDGEGSVDESAEKKEKKEADLTFTMPRRI